MKTLYEQFHDSFDWREGPNYEIIENAKGSARKQLENDLIRNLKYCDPPALAILKSQKAVPFLRKALVLSDGSLKVQIARALWDLEKFAGAVQEISSVLFATSEHRPHNGALDAVLALHGIKTSESRSILEKAIFDPDSLIRYNAARVLAWNLGKDISSMEIHEAIKFNNKERIEEFMSKLGD